jgi:hypothetical protein
MQGARGLPKPRRFGSGFGYEIMFLRFDDECEMYVCLESHGLVQKCSWRENPVRAGYNHNPSLDYGSISLSLVGHMWMPVIVLSFWGGVESAR